MLLDLIESSTKPTKSYGLATIERVKNLVSRGKVGLEIGGPSKSTFKRSKVYKIAAQTDLVNF